MKQLLSVRLSPLNPQALHVHGLVRLLLDVIDKALVQQELDEPDLSGIRGRQHRSFSGAGKIFLNSIQEQRAQIIGEITPRQRGGNAERRREQPQELGHALHGRAGFVLDTVGRDVEARRRWGSVGNCLLHLLGLLPALLCDDPLREQDVYRVLVCCHQTPDELGQRPMLSCRGNQACWVVRRRDSPAARRSSVSLQDRWRPYHILIVNDMTVAGLPGDLARGRKDALPLSATVKAAHEQLGLIERIVRDVKIELTALTLPLKLSHLRALRLHDDLGHDKATPAGMRMTASRIAAAQSA